MSCRLQRCFQFFPFSCSHSVSRITCHSFLSATWATPPLGSRRSYGPWRLSQIDSFPISWPTVWTPSPMGGVGVLTYDPHSPSVQSEVLCLVPLPGATLMSSASSPLPPGIFSCPPLSDQSLMAFSSCPHLSKDVPTCPSSQVSPVILHNALSLQPLLVQLGSVKFSLPSWTRSSLRAGAVSSVSQTSAQQLGMVPRQSWYQCCPQTLWHEQLTFRLSFHPVEHLPHCPIFHWPQLSSGPGLLSWTVAEICPMLSLFWCKFLQSSKPCWVTEELISS